MAYDFSGKKALVTGAGRGIGKKIVDYLVKCKAEVIALDIDQANLNVLKGEIPSVHTICVDLSDWKASRTSVEELEEIDMLVNNAAIVRKGSFEETTEEDIDEIFSVNVKPVINISQVVVKALKKHGKSGSIVNIASIAATKYSSSLAVYSASKATVVKLTETMAVELASYGIRVNAVNPTAVLTEMSASILQGDIAKQITNRTPLRKFAEKEDVAAAVLFLLSDEAKMITGTCLYVDGGSNVA